MIKIFKRMGKGFLLMCALLAILIVAVGLMVFVIGCMDHIHKFGWQNVWTDWFLVVFGIVALAAASYHAGTPIAEK